METEQNQQMPDYHEYAQAVAPKSNKQRNIIIVVIAAVVLLIIISAIYLLVKRQQGIQELEIIHDQQVEQSTRQVIIDVADCPESVSEEDCLTQAVLREAQTATIIEVCEMLEGQQKDNCIWTIAQSEVDSDVCDSIINGDTKEECHNDVLFRLAEDSYLEGDCQKISDESTKNSCLRLVEKNIVNDNKCAEYGVDEVLCDQKSIFDQAVEESNPSLCQSLVDDEMRGECEGSVTIPPADNDGDGLDSDIESELGLDDNNSDVDGDGLTDGEEVNTYNTDPLNPDSDGDSFPDGTEVENGYNPLGEGSL